MSGESPIITSPFNEWPTDIGFEINHEETEPVELKVTGQIPTYVAGVLFRTGPGGHHLSTKDGQTFTMSHWFDGWAQTHRFDIIDSGSQESRMQVTYRSRHTCDGYMEEIHQTGRAPGISFAQIQDPCESLFRKIMSTFYVMTSPDLDGKSCQNIGVTLQQDMPGLSAKSAEVMPKDHNLWVRTDHNHLQQLDPKTLEPLQTTTQAILHPDLKGNLTGAHPQIDPNCGDWYNYNLELGRASTYRVFGVSAATGKATILATLTGSDILGAYVHSMFLTEHYIVLCIFNAYIEMGGLKMLWTKNMIDALYFDPKRKNKWFVIDRIDGRGLVDVYESDGFFSFHTTNAWEEKGSTTTDIVLELSTYENLDILKRFYYENMKATAPGARAYVGDNSLRARPQLMRWKLRDVNENPSTISVPAKPAQCIFVVPKADSVELPTINPTYAMKPSRYIYGCCDRADSVFLDGLIKYDTLKKSAKVWKVHAHSPGEPIFVPDPQGKLEDDGVLLSIVLDGSKGTSYLIVLDARNLEEVGRASMEIAFPFGFHGSHVPISKEQ
ncbi:hypothetical protein MMC27_003819 [Xylographa pallens]|nr:hypothetical protein [Xylographa pallens]